MFHHARTGMGNSRKKFISENEEGAEMKKKMGYLQVILMKIGRASCRERV